MFEENTDGPCTNCAFSVPDSWYGVENIEYQNDNCSNLDDSGNKVTQKTTKKKIVRVCEICGKEYGSLSGYSYHIALHSTLNDIPHKCKQCKKGFVTEADLKTHLVTHESLDKPHKCDYCGKGFAKKSDKPRHERNCSENDNRMFACKRCTEEVGGLESFMGHLVSVHRQEGSHLCEKCSTLFTTRKMLTQHVTKRLCNTSPRQMKLCSTIVKEEKN